jgi:hypothetical protein
MVTIIIIIRALIPSLIIILNTTGITEVHTTDQVIMVIMAIMTIMAIIDSAILV